jgi:hypothetical protein
MKDGSFEGKDVWSSLSSTCYATDNELNPQYSLDSWHSTQVTLWDYQYHKSLPMDDVRRQIYQVHI